MGQTSLLITRLQSQGHLVSMAPNGRKKHWRGLSLKSVDITPPHHCSTHRLQPLPRRQEVHRSASLPSAIKSMESVITFREGLPTCARHYAECRATEIPVPLKSRQRTNWWPHTPSAAERRRAQLWEGPAALSKAVHTLTLEKRAC